MGNFERLENLLLNKRFSELSAEEKAFVLDAVQDEQEYTSMRNALVGSKKVFENDHAISSSVFSKRRLDDHFKKVHGSGGNNRLIVTTIAATALLLVGSWWLFNSLFQNNKRNYEVAEHIQTTPSKPIETPPSNKSASSEKNAPQDHTSVETQPNVILQEESNASVSSGEASVYDDVENKSAAEEKTSFDKDVTTTEVTTIGSNAPATAATEETAMMSDAATKYETEKIQEQDMDKLAVEFSKNKKSESRSATAPSAAQKMDKDETIIQAKTLAKKSPAIEQGVSLDEIGDLEDFFYICH